MDTYYDYEEAVREDIRSYINDHYTDEELKEKDFNDLRDILNDELFTEDSVTGNASGSYWCNSYKSRECVFGDGNAEDYIRELISEYGLDAETIAQHFMDWEYWDVSIRCYLLGRCIDDVLDEFAEQLAEE